MQTVNMHDAKSQLSRLVDDALAGEEIIIAKAGKPLVRLVPYIPQRQSRIPGRLKGQISMADDFDELPAQVLVGLQGDVD